jgi:hypothetical protein
MKLEIPKPLQIEHQELHATLVKATKEPGGVGEAAREVARLLHPHFVREEEFALPPIALLADIALRGVTPQMAEVLPLTRRLRAELPAMLAEHERIVAALEKLRAAARGAELAEYERFADALVLHAQTEEQVLYPAAILVGEHVERILKEAVPALSGNGLEAAGDAAGANQLHASSGALAASRYLSNALMPLEIRLQVHADPVDERQYPFQHTRHDSRGVQADQITHLLCGLDGVFQ